jgi:DNA topoisomerase-1
MISLTDRGRTTTFCVASDCPTVRQKNFIGRCEKCGNGELSIRHGNYGKRFVGCSSYPQCNNSFPLPQRGLIVPTDQRCNACGNPVIKVITRGRPPWVLCLNMQCPAKNGKKSGAKKAESKPKKPRRKSASGKKATPKPVEADIAAG